jgi:trehalose-6-phosphate synthase
LSDGPGHHGQPDAERAVQVGLFPISIDAKGFDALGRSAAVQTHARAIRRDLGQPRLILLGVDRLDYTKGILHRLQAYGELLDEGRLSVPGTVLVQVATPSRERVDQYQQLRHQVEVMVGRINGTHGRLGQPAVHYLHQSWPREDLSALYLAADVMLVTALRDGMNLVAKEYVATRHDEGGALVLSEFAGSAIELKQAHLINPHDVEGVKQAILDATSASPRDAARRMKAMRRKVFDNDVSNWATTFLQTLTRNRAATSAPTGWPEPADVPGPDTELTFVNLAVLDAPAATLAPTAPVGADPEAPLQLFPAAGGDAVPTRMGPTVTGPTVISPKTMEVDHGIRS